MLRIIALVIAVLWLIGLIAHIGGGLINLLIVIALVVFIYDVLVGHRHTNV